MILKSWGSPNDAHRKYFLKTIFYQINENDTIRERMMSFELLKFESDGRWSKRFIYVPRKSPSPRKLTTALVGSFIT